MLKVVRITPRFSTREIIDTTIRKDWFIFQDALVDTGEKLHQYMRDYINKNRKRAGGTGNLANSVNFYKEAGAGLGRVFWGIGDISLLNAKAPEWYVINYGKTTSGQSYIPNYGNFVPGFFFGGDGRPKAEYAGKGKESFIHAPGFADKGMYPKHPIRPMHYIETTKIKLNRSINAILNKLRRG